MKTLTTSEISRMLYIIVNVLVRDIGKPSHLKTVTSPCIYSNTTTNV